MKKSQVCDHKFVISKEMRSGESYLCKSVSKVPVTDPIRFVTVLSALVECFSLYWLSLTGFSAIAGGYGLTMHFGIQYLSEACSPRRQLSSNFNVVYCFQILVERDQSEMLLGPCNSHA